MLELKKPFFSPEGEGGGSGGQEPNVATAEPVKPASGSEDVSGLVNKNKELLGELKETRGIIKDYKEKIEQAKNDNLNEQGEFKTLYDGEQTKNKVLVGSLKRKECRLVASELNDPSDISLVSDKFDYDEDFNITNKDAVLKELHEKKPYLFKNKRGPKIKTEDPQPKIYNKEVEITAEMIRKMRPNEYVAFKKKHNL